MTKAEMKKDWEQVDKILKKYSGASGAHICFIGSVEGGKYGGAGGRTDICAIGVADTLATIVKSTSGMSTDFIDAVTEMAKAMLEDEAGGTVQ